MLAAWICGLTVDRFVCTRHWVRPLAAGTPQCLDQDLANEERVSFSRRVLACCLPGDHIGIGMLSPRSPAKSILPGKRDNLAETPDEDRGAPEGPARAMTCLEA